MSFRRPLVVFNFFWPFIASLPRHCETPAGFCLPRVPNIMIFAAGLLGPGTREWFSLRLLDQLDRPRFGKDFGLIST
jgi:hypothetical protein